MTVSETNTGLTVAQEDAIYDWISAVLPEVTVYWAYPDEIVPTKPCCVLSTLAKPRPEHGPDRKYKEIDTFTNLFHEVFTLSVKVFSNDSNTHVNDVVKSQFLQMHIENLAIAGLVCRYETGMFNGFSALQAKYQFREGVDFIMAFTSELDEHLPEIRKATIQAEFGNAKKDIERDFIVDTLNN